MTLSEIVKSLCLYENDMEALLKKAGWKPAPQQPRFAKKYIHNKKAGHALYVDADNVTHGHGLDIVKKMPHSELGDYIGSIQ